MNKRTIFLTTALPYANGHFHMGHIMEYIMADIWVRFQRMRGHTVHFVGADDAHGAPIMISAQKLGITPQEFVARIAAGRKQYLDGFHVEFDHWHSTDSQENTELSQEIYRRLKQAGLIYTKSIEQFYDPVRKMFLADRFIKGTCPKCGAEDQYGDSCEKCGAVYAPTELINPFSALSGSKPELRESVHYFFKLSDPRCVEFLRAWTRGDAADGTPHIQSEVQAKTDEWLSEDGNLSDWDVSRDAPYFGIEIPDAPGKYFYVWLDAPIGYLASLKSYCALKGINFKGLLESAETEQIHFIGKDIVYFHTLFWPAMLHFSGAPFRVPSHVWAHGFVTVDGKKMSKSRGTGLSPLAYLDVGMDPEWLRYFLAFKFNSKVDDVDFSGADFVSRVNSDLVGKYVNLASRSAGFIVKRFEGKVDNSAFGASPLLQQIRAAADEIAALYDGREYGRALRRIMELTDAANFYVDEQKPWEIAKKPEQAELLKQVCSITLEAFRLLTVYLKPVLPATAEKVEALFGCGPLDWDSLDAPLSPAQTLSPFKHLMGRASMEQVDKLFELSNPANQAAAEAPKVEFEPLEPNISAEDFFKADLRIAKIVKCEKVQKSKKLLRLTVDVGEGRTRNILSGIAAHYSCEQLEGRLVVIIANLEPRKMMGELSEGMLLLASGAAKDSKLYLLSPDSGAEPGMRLH